ncbi:serine/threonine protein kinase [Prosthecobacter sp.]
MEQASAIILNVWQKTLQNRNNRRHSAMPDSSPIKRENHWLPPTAEELQKQLPQYEIVELIGRGGMGAVYKGQQVTLERQVAIKILSTSLDESDGSFAERFRNEARAMARLKHPGIVGVYDFGTTSDGLLYIVMEYIDGTDVSRMISSQGRLHTNHAMAITAHICDALAYAHEQGIIHRDIKPANIMVGHDGVVKVADFGLAKMSHHGQSGLTQSGMTMGTLLYMAPESLMLGTAVDRRADIYAMGVMLYQMLTGVLPQGVFKPPSQVVPGLDPRYDPIISKAMQEDRDTRYPNAMTMRRDLDTILTQPVQKVEAHAAQASSSIEAQALPQRPASQPFRPPQSRAVAPKRKKSSSLLWLVLVTVSGFAGWWLFNGLKPLHLKSSETQTVATKTAEPPPDNPSSASTESTNNGPPPASRPAIPQPPALPPTNPQPQPAASLPLISQPPASPPVVAMSPVEPAPVKPNSLNSVKPSINDPIENSPNRAKAVADLLKLGAVINVREDYYYTGVNITDASQLPPKYIVYQLTANQRQTTRPLTDGDLAFTSVLPDVGILILTDQKKITPLGFAQLGSLKRVGNIQLNGTQIDDSSIQILASIPSLVVLNFEFTQVTDRAVETLGSRQDYAVLSFTGCKITDFSAKTLASFKRLKLLRLKGTEITPQAIAMLRQALPACKFETN